MLVVVELSGRLHQKIYIWTLLPSKWRNQGTSFIFNINGTKNPFEVTQMSLSINLYSSDNAIYSFYLSLTLFVPIFQLLPHTILLKTKRDTLQKNFIVWQEHIWKWNIQNYNKKMTDSHSYSNHQGKINFTWRLKAFLYYSRSCNGNRTRIFLQCGKTI